MCLSRLSRVVVKNMTLHVCKFGGTSVGSADAIDAVAAITDQLARRDRVAIVVSAVTGVTDTLLRSANAALAGKADHWRDAEEWLRTRHLDIARALVVGSDERAAYESTVESLLGDFSQLCFAVSAWKDSSPRAVDAILSLGEQLSAPLVSAVLRDRGVASEPIDAATAIVTNATFGNATPDFEQTRERLRERIGSLIDRGIVPVVTGFLGATETGEISTLGRGGSDYTAALVASALDADVVTFFKEVDGVMTADPRLVPHATTLAHVSYQELSELACFGASVIQYKAARLLADRRIPVSFRNTFNPEHPGTQVGAFKSKNAACVKAVTSVDKMSAITIDNPVAVRGVSQGFPVGWLGLSGEPVLTISHESPEDRTCQYIVPSARVSDVQQCIFGSFAVCTSRDATRPCLRVDDNLAVVSVVGDGLRTCGRTIGRVLGALGKEDISVRSAVFGGAESAIRIVVDSADAASAVRAVHRLIG